MTIVFAPAASGPAGDCTASTRIRGVAETVQCFDWCVADHGRLDLFHAADVYHVGSAVTVSVPRNDSEAEVFSARVLAYPNLGTATVMVDHADECTELDAEQAEALADDLISAASRIRGLARQIGGAA